MTIRIVSEAEFAQRIRTVLFNKRVEHVGCVTGPGRSGAVAAVYASHILGIPFIPFGANVPDKLELLLIDTARESGRTLRKSASWYTKKMGRAPTVIAVYEEPPRIAFWYEARKPQRYRHELGFAA
ncbi:hypothetical protein [Bradyrhizobium elkanii]|uniref:hypothetical protein n=1 Tax=Bradyrhizobium elkanii TaxID=29448 RepID=UPI001449BDD0|nr:hypothetical protein [Bradyrhizobium elkanii]MCP1932193.1 hypothetical protein [Bradyrhizobium elkanii]MCS3577267.1 hypothetical protein [Bradyrhizobium elkanii]MCS3720144.1 hypothetical protein [Bradyrhizobium elkanii]MCS4004561.1 hypothetical protein [Bradyrhizobium elkanii USDA 61]BBB99718.1 hypothetical protein BE61_51670 [Bradyrhizobium elkanii USDA 61]